MRSTGYEATHKQLDAKTEAWRKEQAYKEEQERKRQTELLEESVEVEKRIEYNTANNVEKGSRIDSSLGGVITIPTANEVEKKSDNKPTADTVNRNKLSGIASSNFVNSVTNKLFGNTNVNNKPTANKNEKKTEESGGGAPDEGINPTVKKIAEEKTANAIAAITQKIDKEAEAKEARANDVDTINRDTSELRADAQVKARKEAEYREKILKALTGLKNAGKTAVKKTKSFFEQLMDFLKGMTAFGGILALLGWLK
jgi:hypothetical protein